MANLNRFSFITFTVLAWLLANTRVAMAADCDPDGNIAGLPCLETQESTTKLGPYLDNIRDYLLGFSAALAVLFIVWGGLLYITSAGNEERNKTAKATLTYAIIGLVFILLAKVILTLITGDLLSSVFTGDSPY